MGGLTGTNYKRDLEITTSGLRLIYAAQTYGIKVEQVHCVKGWHKAPECYYGCDVNKRILYVEETYSGHYNPTAVLLHELSHIVCAVPWLDGSEPEPVLTNGDQIATPEQLFLFQYEDALARECDVELTWVDHYRRFADVALPGAGHSFMSKWNEIDNRLPGSYQRKTYWWAWGVEFCKTIGLLDQNERITWKFPNWTPETIKMVTELSDQLDPKA